MDFTEHPVKGSPIINKEDLPAKGSSNRSFKDVISCCAKRPELSRNIKSVAQWLQINRPGIECHGTGIAREISGSGEPCGILLTKKERRNGNESPFVLIKHLGKAGFACVEGHITSIPV